MSPALPTLVCVHGAWHNPSTFDLLRAQLEPAGYNCVTPALQSMGLPADPKDNVTDHLEDVQIVRTELEKLVAEGKDIVMFMHSYGGIVGSDAMEGLLKVKGTTVEGKEQGNSKGGVVKAIYFAAFIPKTGKSLADMFDEPADYLRPNPSNAAYLDLTDAHEILYNDMARTTTAPYTTSLRPQAAGAFASAARYNPWADGLPCVYIKAALDQGVYPTMQDAMTASAREDATAEWSVREVMRSHSAWLSAPGELAEIVREVVEGI